MSSENLKLKIDREAQRAAKTVGIEWGQVWDGVVRGAVEKRRKDCKNEREGRAEERRKQKAEEGEGEEEEGVGRGKKRCG